MSDTVKLPLEAGLTTNAQPREIVGQMQGFVMKLIAPQVYGTETTVCLRAAVQPLIKDRARDGHLPSRFSWHYEF
jgi:hypothetical protein